MNTPICSYKKCLSCHLTECYTGQIARQQGEEAYNQFVKELGRAMVGEGLGRYDRIDYVTYNDGSKTYLITGTDVDSAFEVDIQSDCWFNTGFDVVERTTVKKLSNVSEIVDFAKTLGIDLTPYYNGRCLFVGGEKDCAVYENLQFDWIVGE